MSIFEAIGPAKPTPEQAALRIRRTLAQIFNQVENSLGLVRLVMERHGRSAIDDALGPDRADVEKLYQALKTVVEKNKPGSKVPELPTKSKKS